MQHFGTSNAATTHGYTSPGAFTGTAQAWATYGLVGAIADATATGSAYETQLVQAEAAFTDQLTITGATGPGFIVYQYSFTGSLLGTSHQAHGHGFVRHGTDPDEELDHLTGNAVILSQPHTFTFGSPFAMGLLLTAEVHMHDGFTGHVQSDFSAGAMLTGIQVFDAQMTPVSQVAITSQSGTIYPLPSPASGLVFLGALAARRRR